MNFKVLIVGCGAQGKVISTDMARAPEVDEIRLGDISLQVCKRHTDWLKSEKVTIHRVDASKVDQVASLAKGVDVVVNAVIPQFNVSIMDAAVKSGAHYIDLAFGPPYENIDREFEKNATLRDANLTAITGTGTAPGLTNTLAARAVDKLDRVDSIFVRIFDMLEAKEPISTWSPRTLIEDCMLEPVIFENGEFKKVSPFSGEETYAFPDPAIGTQTVWYHMHEEPHMLGRTMKDKSLKNCNVKMGPLAAIKSLFDMGFLGDKHISVKGVSVVPWEFAASLLPAPPTLEELKQKMQTGIISDSHAIILVDVTGKKGGNKERRVLWALFPSIRDVVKTYPIATHTSYMAGINTSLYARALGRGEIKTAGVLTPELLEQNVRQKYLDELAKQDPPIIAYERVEKRIN